MAEASNTHIMIVGAGLAGALMACYLGKAGFKVTVYERRPDPRIHGFVGGRSINLALAQRGITALKEVGLAEKVLSRAIPMYGRMIHDIHGNTRFQPYSGNPDDAIYSVQRGQLNITLLDGAQQYENVTIHFDHRCIDIDLDQPAAHFHNTRTGQKVHAHADLIIGADGAYSAVRSRMQKEERFNFSQEYLNHGYKQLDIPSAADIPSNPYSPQVRPDEAAHLDGFAMEPNALHIWPRGGYMMIALPNLDRTFTCICFWPYQGDSSFASIKSDTDIEPFFQERFPDAVPLMPTLRETYTANPASSLVTVRCMPWHYKDKVVLIGDASHAIVPFYGQGMNAAFEDCRILNQYIHQFNQQWDIVLERFTNDRKPHADAIADLALANFIEMRDTVASPLFRARKTLENTLHRWMPKAFVPLYNMVCFSDIPYADAIKRAASQWRLLIAVAAALFVIVTALLLGLITLLVT